MVWCKAKGYMCVSTHMCKERNSYIKFFCEEVVKCIRTFAHGALECIYTVINVRRVTF